MIYTKKIEDITWDHVEAFCEQQVSEGAHLDYKQDFPAKNEDLAKTMAAMANTLGGIILIGVEENNENKPVLPMKGIEFQRGLSEKVMNIILSNITPYFIPDIQACPKEDKAVIVIRIPQSHQTPHAISGNTLVYLRTGNRNKPEELADLEKISWLQNQRRKSEELREWLYKQAEERFVNVWQMLKIKSQDYDLLKNKSPSSPLPIKGLLTISLCPSSPKDPFYTPPEMKDIYDYIKCSYQRGRFPYDHVVPETDSRIVQDGFVVASRQGGGDVKLFHTELNCFGLYLHKEWVNTGKFPMGDKTSEVIPASDIFCLLDLFIQSAAKFYQKLGYGGPLDFKVDLDNIRGCALGFYSPSDGDIHYSPDLNVHFSKVILAHTLEHESTELILAPARRIHWAFGGDVTPEDLNACLQRYGLRRG